MSSSSDLNQPNLDPQSYIKLIEWELNIARAKNLEYESMRSTHSMCLSTQFRVHLFITSCPANHHLPVSRQNATWDCPPSLQTGGSPWLRALLMTPTNLFSNDHFNSSAFGPALVLDHGQVDPQTLPTSHTPDFLVPINDDHFSPSNDLTRRSSPEFPDPIICDPPGLDQKDKGIGRLMNNTILQQRDHDMICLDSGSTEGQSQFSLPDPLDNTNVTFQSGYPLLNPTISPLRVGASQSITNMTSTHERDKSPAITSISAIPGPSTLTASPSGVPSKKRIGLLNLTQKLARHSD